MHPAVAGTYTFDNDNVTIESLAGLNPPPIRADEKARPLQHGGTVYAQYFSPRPLSIQGAVYGSSESDLQDRLDSLNKYFQPAASEATLTINNRIIFCRPVSAPVYEFSAGQLNWVKYQIQLKASDPIIYSSNLKSSSINLPTATGGFSFLLSFPLAFGTVSTGGLYTANNAGNIAVYPSLVKIYGPVDNPQLKNVTTGELIKLNISVVSGNYLELDFKNKTIMLNGTASRYSYLDSSSKWFQMKPGDNEIRYTANTYQAGSYCQFQFRDGWL